MKTEWRRFAPVGLIIAGIAALAAFILFMIYRNPRALPFLISVGLVLVGLALFALLDPERVRVAVTGRQARHGSNALVRTIAFVGIVVVANILIFKLVGLYPDKTKLDLTEGKQNTLADETIDTLAQLPEPVIATGFYSPQSAGAQENADVLLRRFAENSGDNFTYEFIDPDANPLDVKQAGIPAGKDGVISLQMGEKRELVEFASEQNLTSGLVRLMSSEQRTIYFLTGHGEYNPEDTGDAAYSTAKTALTGKNYIVKVLNLRTDTAIPVDAKVIIVAGPKKPVSEEEVNMLADYVSTGGALIVLYNTPAETEFGDSEDPLAAYLLSSWGVLFGNNYVVQVLSNQPGLEVVGAELAQHPIISDDLANTPPIFIGVQTVEALETSSGATATTLIKSSAYYENCFPACSWSTTNLDTLTEDVVGPLPLAVAIELSSTNTRIAVFGDATFAADKFYGAYGNGDLFVNTVDWAAGQEDLISLTPKDTTTRTLNISPENMQTVVNALFLGLVIGMPALVVFAGGVNWFIRRRRG